ncbi:F-box/FBD/LRR-repeat protein At2g04230 [Linum perenne]
MKRKRKGCSDILHFYSPDDRISRLPDDILLLVLSSLTFKDAIVTSLLSRRWRYLCASLPRLDFDASIILGEPIYMQNDKRIPEFIKGVKKVLRLYRGQSVEELRLCLCLSKRHTAFIKYCVRFALSKKVQKLEFDFNSPHGVVNRAKNYVFEVVAWDPDFYFIHDPSLDGFKLLKSLCFKSVIMGGGVLNGLLLNCPVLERLTFHHVSNLGCVKVVGPSLRLKHLEMINCPGLNEIEICDVPIVSMKRWWCGEDAVRMNKVPCLTELSVSASLKVVDEFTLFSSCLSQLESLKLRVGLADLKPLEQNAVFLVFLTKLRELEVTCGTSNDLLPLARLMEAPPHLHKIVIRVINPMAMVKRGTINLLKEPERRVGVLEQLKVLEFAGYCGATHEDEFILHITENAATLKTVIIDSSRQKELPNVELVFRNEIRVREEYVRGHAKEWLEGIIPSRVRLVIR